MRLITLAAKATLLSALLITAGCDTSDYETLSGESGRFSQLEGRWLVINYWATWCEPCREEIPELNALAEAHADTITVFGVNYDGLQGDALREAAEGLGIRFDSLLHDPRQVLDYPMPRVLPTTVIIDPDGRVKHTLIGPQTVEMLLEATSHKATDQMTYAVRCRDTAGRVPPQFPACSSVPLFGA